MSNFANSLSGEKLKKNFEKLLKREGVFLFHLLVFIFREGVFAMRMKHPPCPLHKGDFFKGL